MTTDLSARIEAFVARYSLRTMQLFLCRAEWHMYWRRTYPDRWPEESTERHVAAPTPGEALTAAEEWEQKADAQETP